MQFLLIQKVENFLTRDKAGKCTEKKKIKKNPQQVIKYKIKYHEKKN